MSYPRKIELENDQLKTFLIEKGEVVNDGRKLTTDIELIEKKQATINNELLDHEKKIDISQFDAEIAEVTELINTANERSNDLKKRIGEHLKANAPQDLIDEYHSLDAKRKELEKERSQLAIQAQKYNDRIVPLARDLLKPHLENEYEDYETLKIEGDKVAGYIFSWLDDWKKKFAQRKNENTLGNTLVKTENTNAEAVPEAETTSGTASGTASNTEQDK